VPTSDDLHVLCVEDNVVNLQLVRELLALRPAVRLRTAETGREGIAAALTEPPDLLLLDLQLPDQNGMDVMRTLRATPALAACRIVALSADAMPEHINAALAAGFDDYWTKPIQFDRFLSGIDRMAAACAQRRHGRGGAAGAAEPVATPEASDTPGAATAPAAPPAVKAPGAP
jgi:CheY-like chemotaxis protein